MKHNLFATVDTCRPLQRVAFELLWSIPLRSFWVAVEALVASYARHVRAAFVIYNVSAWQTPWSHWNMDKSFSTLIPSLMSKERTEGKSAVSPQRPVTENFLDSPWADTISYRELSRVSWGPRWDDLVTMSRIATLDAQTGYNVISISPFYFELKETSWVTWIIHLVKHEIYPTSKITFSQKTHGIWRKAFPSWLQVFVL